MMRLKWLMSPLLIGVACWGWYRIGTLDGWLDGFHDANATLKVKIAPRPAIETSVITFGQGAHDMTISGILIESMDDGTMIRLQAERKLPPRCRDVPEGAGCLDWLEPGEKNWTEVLKHRLILCKSPECYSEVKNVVPAVKR